MGRSTVRRSGPREVSGGRCAPPRPGPSGPVCSWVVLFVAGEGLVAGEVQRPAVVDVDALTHGLPASAVAVQVAVDQGDPGAVLVHGGEGDLDLAGAGQVGGHLPVRADVP